MKKFAVKVDDLYLANAYLKFLKDQEFTYIGDASPEHIYLVPYEDKRLIFVDDLPVNYPLISLLTQWDLARKFIEDPEYDINVGDTVRFTDESETYKLTSLKLAADEWGYFDEKGSGIFVLGEEEQLVKVKPAEQQVIELIYTLKKENKDTIKLLIKELKKLC
jgi:hypothetical protein